MKRIILILGGFLLLGAGCLPQQGTPARQQSGFNNQVSVTSQLFVDCDYKKYSGRGQSSGCASTDERCYNGTKTACGPGDDCSTLARAGDNICHPLCNTNSDCSAGSYCESVQYFTGDVINEYKLCMPTSIR